MAIDSSPVLRAWDDDERARCVVGALLAHRPQEEAGETAATARPDHEEIGVAGGIQKFVCCPSLGELALDFEPWSLSGCANRGVQNVLGRTAGAFANLLNRWAGRGQADYPWLGQRLDEGHHPCVDDMKDRPAKTSFRKRPTKRLISTRGSVYSDDDLAHRP
ncbi:MAG: hypothetical protein WD027_08810 [Gaiellales bacterium]